jgi:hypothetical protein
MYAAPPCGLSGSAKEKEVKDAAKEKEVQDVSKALEAHNGRLLSTRLCSATRCDDPSKYYIPTALGIDKELWKRTQRAVMMSRVLVTRVRASAEIKLSI